jgi:hypothetical protein
MQRIELPAEEARFPLDLKGVPITYLSVNDFLNLANELRTVPEIVEYLNARRSLSPADQRVIGDEKAMFAFYLINSASFQGCRGRADAAALVAKGQDRLRELRAKKSESDGYSTLLEHVAHELATRDPDCALDLRPELLGMMDDPSKRKNYSAMQAVLANLRLRERAELGRAFHGAIQRMKDAQEGFTYIAGHLDARPDWVFVFGASKNLARADVVSRSLALMGAAMAHYEKPQCMSIIDRQGEGYEVAIARSKSDPSEDERAAGRELFGQLKMNDRDCTGLGPV